MKYFMVAGEQSGDLHGSNLIREIRRSDPEASILCWGGDLMCNAGAGLLRHYRDTAFMGFTVILKNLRVIANNLALCKEQIADFNPDVLILIDYPGFNLRIAKFAKEKGLKVFYYISPKFWAWNEGRVRKVKKYVDRMYIILPFETEFYRKHGITAGYRGNPVMDEIERKRLLLPSPEDIRSELKLDNKPVICLLAGSRRHEVEINLPRMLGIVDKYPGYNFVIAAVDTLPEKIYADITGNSPVRLVTGKTYELLSISEASVTVSGTATLETALFNVPQVVCYRGDFFSMLIAWLVIKVKYISLVNLIAGREVVKEILGYNVRPGIIDRELRPILSGGDRRQEILKGYEELREKLGPQGASARVAEDMVNYLRGSAGN